MEKPTVAQLDESLKDLVKNWKRFALHLPGIGSTDIDIIKEDTRDDVVQQKIALYTKWLKIYPDASWEDVVTTLEKVEENTIAQQLRDKYLINVKTKEEAAPTLVGEADNSPISMGLSISTSESVPVSSIIEEVAIEEDVVTKLDSLEQSFSDLTYDVKREVKGAEQRNGSIEDVVFKVQQARAYHINSLQSVKTTDELFEAIYPHYNFLNCHLIIRIALFLCGIIAEKANKYKENIVEFMKTTKVACLKDELKRYHQRRFPAHGANCTFIEIKVENGWGDQPLWLVEMLVKTLFPVKHPDELPWYDIVPGSVIMTFIALEHMTSSLIESSRKKTEFMRLIGVISLKIGDELVWQREDGDAVLSFEDSLIRATLANNIEAVQFILQYTQVDINTRNINSSLLQLSEGKSSFITHFHLVSIKTFKSFRATFTILMREIEQVLQPEYMKKPSGHPDYEFLNCLNLSEIAPHLPKSLSGRVEHYIHSLENMVKRRLLLPNFAKYLDEYFSTPSFPGSIKVSLTLHSAVWSTCSVWYVEQLGQLIFTPTLFYQLQWFRVNRYEESVRVCLLADKELVSNLVKSCLSTNNELQTSMLGVVSVQIDDTVVISNDYSDGFAFNEAIELAKLVGDDEILDLLQQMQNPVNESNYEVGSIDDNGNCSFRLHPDSTPLMIACCNDNSQLVQLLLDHNADPNIRNGRGVTALMYSTGNNKIFQMLIDHGAEHSNVVTNYNELVIYFACIAGNVRVVKNVLQSNSLPNIRNMITGDTPLILASVYNHVQVVEMLLQAGADPNIQNNEGFTALMEASKYGNEEIVQQLLQANADPDIRNNEQETAVYLTDNEDIVDQLVKADADLSMYSAFLHGVFIDDELPADDDRNEESGEEEFKEFKRVVLNASTQSDKLGLTLCMAADKGKISLAEALIKGNANPNILVHGDTPLLTAVAEGYVKLVQKLLEAHADPNMQNADGTAPLMIAYNNTESSDEKTLIRMLLQANANPNVMDGEGNTILTKGCYDQDTEIVDILLQAKANPNIKDFEGNTPLMIACSNDDVEIVSMLLQAGADPTIFDNKGNTALDYATEDFIADMLFDTINKTANAYKLLFLVAIGISYLEFLSS